jgi:hypothetical protein
MRIQISKEDFALEAFLRTRGIDLDVADERGYRCMDSTTELLDLGFVGKQNRSGIVIPLHPITEGSPRLAQLRPWKPRLDEKGKAVKYETPFGRSLRLDVHPFCRDDLDDFGVPLWITEGIGKADAAVSVGLCCVALLGVDTWRRLDHERNAIPLRGRTVYLAFDSDTWTKVEVLRALHSLTEFLVGLGAEVWHVRFPTRADGAKVGMDDYLAEGRNVADLIALADDWIDPAKGRLLFGTLAEEWINTAPLRPTTRANYRHLLAHQLTPWLEVPLANITFDAVDRWVGKMRTTCKPGTGRPPARASVVKAHALLSKV